MKHVSRVHGLFGLFIFLLCLQTGCQVISPHNPVSTEAGIPVDPGLSTQPTAAVRFQIVLPPQQGLHSQPSANILADPGIKTIWVTFKIILVNIGFVGNPTTTLVRTVLADASGTAVATFPSLPAKTCVGDIHIEGGNVGSFTDFQGAADLVSNATTTLFVGPKGKHGKEDVLAEAILRIVASESLFVRATTGLASQMEANLVGLDLELLATNSYDAVLDNWQGRLNASAPANVWCQAGDAKNTLSWDLASGAVSYNIYWSFQPGVTKASGTPLIGKISGFVHDQLTNGVPYYYVVTSVGPNGESLESKQVAGLPTAAASTAVSLGGEVANVSQNVQIILTGVPADFSTTVGLVDNRTGENFYLFRSPSLSWPNARKVTLIVNDPTVRTARTFNSLGFTTPPPAGARIEVWDPDGRRALATVTMPGGSRVPVEIGKTLTGLNQNLQIVLTRVPSTFDVTTSLIDRNNREEVTFAKSPTLSFPDFQRLVLTTTDSTLRELESVATLTFSAALPAGARIDMIDTDRGVTLATVVVPGAGWQAITFPTTVSGMNQNMQVIVRNVTPEFITTATVKTTVFDDRTGEAVILAKSTALSSTTSKLVLAVDDLSIRSIRPFTTLEFTSALPSLATVEIYDPDNERTVTTKAIP